MPKKQKKELIEEPSKPVKKKRGRKPKKKPENEKIEPKIKKKRGRKPRGGKIVELKKKEDIKNEKIQINCILHLKCSSCEIDAVSNNIQYTNLSDNIKPFELENSKNKTMKYNEINDIKYKEKKGGNDYIPDSTQRDPNLKEIWSKLRELKYKLHKNDMMDKKSNCFWCTYGFTNPPIYIPKRVRNDTIEAYGCFCSPECAVSHLKNEPIDTSTRWERYSMLNNIYCKIYNYEKNIKPAPDPYYTLDKYYGNLSIQEYRKLLLNDRLLLVVDKPVTKIMPELYEESHENPLIYNNMLDVSFQKKSGKSKYRLQRRHKKETKKNIMQSKFNMV